MTTTNDSSTSAPAGSGPAFPMPGLTGLPTGEFIYGEHGMSLRVYAAIALRVPDSGLGWLDDMIRAAQRHELSGRAMQGWLSTYGDSPQHPSGAEANPEWARNLAESSDRMADAMLRARCT